MTPESESNPIQFQPLGEGLGFHPFANGLPYAPVSKSQTSPTNESATPATRTYETVESAGSGATAAGRPRFAMPPRPIAPPRLPAGAPQLGGSRAMVAPSATTVGRVPQIPVARPITPAPAASTIPAPQPARAAPIRVGPGYTLQRVLAFGLDLALNSALCVAILSSGLWNQSGDIEILLNPGVAPLSALFVFFFSWALVTAQEVLFGTSIGKRVFGLTVQGSPAAIFLRAFFFLPSLGFGGIGILWALFDPKRRCWHDVAADLQPLRLVRG